MIYHALPDTYSHLSMPEHYSFVRHILVPAIVLSFLYGSTSFLYLWGIITELLITSFVGAFVIVFVVSTYALVFVPPSSNDGGHNRPMRSSKNILLVTSAVMFILITFVGMQVAKEEFCLK